MSLQLNLQKGETALKLCLEKAGILTPPEVELCFNMDVSGSFENEHQSGATNALMNRMVPWGMVFDPDKKLDFFTFSSGLGSAFYVGEVTSDNCDNFIKKHVYANVPGWCGGTYFTPVLKENLIQFGWEKGHVTQSIPVKKPGFFSKIFSFGKKESVPDVIPGPSNTPRKSMIIHVTDGASFDHDDTLRLLEYIEQAGYAIYIMFFGIGAGRVGEQNIMEYSSRFKNVGHYICDDINDFINSSNEEINEKLITPEMVEWLKA